MGQCVDIPVLTGQFHFELCDPPLRIFKLTPGDLPGRDQADQGKGEDNRKDDERCHRSGFKTITNTSDGDNVLGIRGVFFDLLAQPANMYVNRPAVTVIIVSPHAR